jgi:hypothetical protein
MGIICQNMAHLCLLPYSCGISKYGLLPKTSFMDNSLANTGEKEP